MADRNGVCKRSIKTGERMHVMKDLQDGQGRKFKACVRCGSLPVKVSK